MYLVGPAHSTKGQHREDTIMSAAESEDSVLRRGEQAESLIRKEGFERWALAKVERHGMESQKPQF